MPKSGSNAPQSALSETSSLSQKHQPKQQLEDISFFGKVFASLNPFPKVDKYQDCLHAHDFCAENQVLVGAIAWSGYQQLGKGLVLVQDKEESPPQIQYIPRKLLKKTMCQQRI